MREMGWGGLAALPPHPAVPHSPARTVYLVAGGVGVTPMVSVTTPGPRAQCNRPEEVGKLAESEVGRWSD